MICAEIPCVQNTRYRGELNERYNRPFKAQGIKLSQPIIAKKGTARMLA